MQASGMQSSSNAPSSRPTTTLSGQTSPSSSSSRTSSGSTSSSSSSGKLPSKHTLHNRSWSHTDASLTLGQSSNRNSPRFSKLLGTVLTSPFAMASDDDVMVDGTFVSVPGAQTITRPPSPALSANFSFISPPSPALSALALPPNLLVGILPEIAPPDITPTCSFFASPVKSSPHSNPCRLGKRLLPRLWDALSSPGKKIRTRYPLHADGLPLDGEEGELIDDEACFIDVTAASGFDILSLLPPEISLYLFLYLDLPSIVACLSVSRRWRSLANDNLIWRELFYRNPGWKIDVAGAARRLQNANSASTLTVNSRLGQAFEEWSRSMKRLSNSHRISTCSSVDMQPEINDYASLVPLNWQELYKTRLELDQRWVSGEPKTTRISGHADSVYCIEFDSENIITGSRDKTIKIWSMRTGKLQTTLRGHAGSVLCLKFDNSGFMVSGSSDCTVFVWDLNALKGGRAGAGASAGAGPGMMGAGIGAGELVQRVLKGHTLGVLDLRIDQDWIVSCSKDALIRVWSRKTLTLFTTFRGHEGPVNAVGLQDGKVVSASGDGNMMLWDIASGTRIRTFEGHDRGLACIEFKDDVIVSGSNDCKIKVWSASTGECLQTLVGHDYLVRALSFDPSSGRVVSASYDKTIKVWDIATGKMVREFKNSHPSYIFDVKFDVCRIVSTSHDRKIVVLDFSQDLDTSLFV